MSDVNANIGVHIDTSAALAELKALQKQLALFYSNVAKGSAAAQVAQKGLQTNLLNSINATGKFTAQMGYVRTSTESFTHALENNKLSMREYFRYAGGATRTFGKLFRTEFDTIGRVAEERVKKMQTQYIKMGRDANGAMQAIAVMPKNLNMKDMATQTAMAAQKQALFNQLVKQGSTNLLNFGKNTQWAGRQLMVGFSVPLAYFGTAAAKTFMDLEAQAIKFKRVYGDMFTATGETQKALDDIQKLAESFTKYGVAVVDTMKMASEAAAMGKTGAELTAQVAEATRLAILGNVEQSQALETTTSLTNAFGIAAEDLASKINFLNAVENQTVVSIEDLTTAIPKAGPVVKQLGGSVEDLAFFLTAMKEGGINASEGANALKSGLASLINPTKKASQMLQDMGVNIKGIVEANAGNLKATVVGFAQALDTLAPLDRARAIEQLFGKFQFARLSTLFQNITKDGTQANRVLGLTQSSVEELAILAEREMKTVEDAVGTQFKASMQDLKLAIAPIGKTFLQAVTPIVKGISRIFEGFNNLGDGTKKFLVVLTTLAGIVGPALLMTFGLVANGAANIIKLFLTMKVGFSKLSGSSTVLAEQTTYMNSAQLEAATVAASLNQAHSRLTQQFALETEAITLLRNAYLEATAAAANFARVNPGMMMPGKGGKTPRGFASGIQYVPGTGNKDSVPAMLMPGEAVIPKDIAQSTEGRSLLGALFSGKLKKFGTGTPDAGDQFTHIGQSSKMDIDKLLENPNLTANDRNRLEFYKKFLKSTGKSGVSNTRHSLGFSFSGSLNRGLANRNGISFAEFEKEWIARGPGKWAASGFSAAEAAIIDDAMLESLRKRNINPGGRPRTESRITDSTIEEVFKRGLPNEVTKTSTYQRMLQKYQSVASYTIGPGLGSTPQSAQQLLQKAIANGGAPNYPIKVINGDEVLPNGQKISEAIGKGSYRFPEKAHYIVTRTGSKGDTKISGLHYIDDNGNRVSLGKGAGGARTDITEKPTQAKSREVAAQKGEFIKDTNGKYIPITDKNSKPKPKNVKTKSAKDNRVVTLKPNQSIIPSRYRGIKWMAGADGGLTMGPDGKISAGAGVPMSQVGAIGPRALIERNLKLAEEARKANTTALEKESKQITQSTQQQKVYGQKASQVSGALGALAIGASFTGGKLGEVAQKILPLIFAIQGISMLTQNLTRSSMALTPMKSTLIVATAMLGSFYLATKSIRDTFNKANREALDLGTQISSTKQALDGLAKFAGKVSAQELADYKRNKQFSPFSVQAGKTTFGSAFVQGEQGKAMVSALTKTITDKNAGGRQGAQQQLLSQLSTGVATGLFSVEQARSLAVNVAEQLGDLPLGLTVAAQLDSLMGPDGNNLLKTPLKVRLQLIQESTKQVGKTSQAAQNAGGFKLSNMGLGSMNKNIGIGGMVAAGAGIGAAAGTVVPGIGNAVGAVVGAAAGAIAGGFIAVKAIAGQAKIVGQLTGAAVASQQAALNQQNELRASLDQYYEKLIKQAEAEGNIARVKELQNKLIAARNILDKQSLKTNEAIIKSYDSSKGNTQAGLLNAAKESVKSQYKGTGQEQFTGAAQELLKGVGGRNEYVLTVNMGAGNINPSDMITLVNVLGKDKKSYDKVINIMTRFGGKTGGQVAQVIGAFVDKNGKQNSKVSSNFIAKLDLQKTGPEAQQFIDFYAALGQSAGIIDVGVVADYYLNDKNKGAKDALQSTFDAIKKNEGKLDLEIASTFLPPKAMGAVDVDYFNKLNQAQRAVYLQEVATIINMDQAKVQGSEDFKKWQKEAGPLGGSQYSKLSIPLQIQKYADALGQTVTNARVDLTIAPPTGGDTAGAGQRPTYLDDLLTRLKRVRDASVNAQGGLAELRRVMLKAGGDIKIFKGIDQQLAKLGANSELISFIGELEPAIQKKFIKIKNGMVTLTKDGEKLFKTWNEVIIGDFENNNEQLAKQFTQQSQKFRELRAAGISAADALELISDADNAAALAAAKTTQEYNRLTTSIKNRKKAEEEMIRTTDPEKYWQMQMDKAMEYYDVLEREARRSFQPQIDKLQETIDLNNKLIDTKQREIEMNYDRPIAALEAQSTILNHDLSLMDHSAQAINDKYDAQEKALNSIQQVNQQIIDQEKGRLDIASALTSGDISAAAQAVQQLRATDASAAQQRATDSISAARQLEIDNLRNSQGFTRAQIEEKIYQIGEQVYALEQAKLPLTQQIVRLQDENYNIQVKQLEPLQEELNKRLKNIDSQRQAWTDTQTAIDGAKVRGEEYNKAMLIGQGIIDQMKKLWDGIISKTVTLTVVQNTISGNSSAGLNLSGLKMNYGGMVPKYFATGGMAIGSDTVPAMLTPGEFIVNKTAAQAYEPFLKSINESTYPSMLGSSASVSPSSIMTSVADNSSNLYNYNLGFNINGSNIDAKELAGAVITEIKRVDAQRIRKQKR